MPRQRTWTDEELAEAVKESFAYSQVAVKMGLHPGNKTCAAVRDKIRELNLDISHFVPGRRKTGIPGVSGWTVPDDRLFIVGTVFNTNHKRRYLAIVKYECRNCGLSEWLGEKLILQVDHVDGDRKNNTLENLRLMCPNCHSQTETWSRRKQI